jgi:hypothetical protein
MGEMCAGAQEMNDALSEAIRYRVTNYPRAPVNPPQDARERCFWCDHWKPVGETHCDPGERAAL